MRVQSMIWESRYRNPPPIPMSLASACMSAKTDHLVCEQTSIQESHLIKEGSSSIELFNAIFNSVVSISHNCPNASKRFTLFYRLYNVLLFIHKSFPLRRKIYEIF